jgi:hypothetical protein
LSEAKSVISRPDRAGPSVAVGRDVARAADPAVEPAEVRRALPILDVGCCEPFKAAIHGAALGLTVLMGAYNAAAWLRRRQRHLAINTLIYLAAAVWEERHVRHHIRECFPIAPKTAKTFPRLATGAREQAA